MTRKEALKVLIETKEIPHLDTMPNRRVDEALSVAIEALKAEPKRGEWIFKDRDDAPYYECSKCGAVVLFGNQYNYCTYCADPKNEVAE